ncbi:MULTISPECIES: antibiotic biosynthesis monooxygenase family protein [unclassified Sulfitobacter]|jgi:heme-degrading monooxygenase HmoA|uniref:antibiotic biosynthesis monooxygenase family protein n=1 Tax=unclassified Sulfitobacter TaxID=196795 RepID=UPI0007C2759D|nr:MULTISPECIES: antibiotic biosynthesis monooxygenase [unclassified Sulfitobacter]KZX93949.1 antibiotic biosynthesis monooxygenase [Sulfitobacter sp. HI0023]KZY25768.1 antibiotic biosynthesis monooxygenase [Sulfitobacter sp. HI0040]KZZ70972.1 antibiotic biosynthesis monooxygenase [Sulfitobacter sp. HI0129]
MIAVIFEVYPDPDRRTEYLDLAAKMRPLVEQIDGFISVERFQSLTDPDKLLSISVFRDEEALEEWRKLTAHRGAQQRGRDTIFRDYRLRVAHVLRDYGMNERDEAPVDSRAVHDGTAKAQSAAG